MKKIEIEWIDPRKLKPYKQNARIHPQEQVEKILAQIKAHGWDVPIVLDKNLEIIKGHGRHLASLLGKLKKVPVIIREDLSKEQVRAARLADNKLSESQWDMSLVGIELSDLKDLEFDIELTGFYIPKEKETSETSDVEWGEEDVEEWEEPKPKVKSTCPKCGHKW